MRTHGVAERSQINPIPTAGMEVPVLSLKEGMPEAMTGLSGKFLE